MNFRILIIVLLTIVSLPSVAQNKTNPQLRVDNIDEVIASMTLDEKISLIRGIGMKTEKGDGPAAGKIDGKVPGAAGGTFSIPRLGIPQIIVADGPAGLRIDTIRHNDSKRYYTTAFPIGTSLASTWDTQLMTEVGEAIGNEVLDYGVDIWLAPALNIQRNPLCGRNFEYYSEDPVVSGKIASAIVKGVQSKGVGTSIKHFAVNNQETNRSNVDAILSERALREIYLKGFEIAVKEANPWTVMSAYNKVNGTYASESYDLLTTILRDEWRFNGFVMTDWFAGRNYPQQVKAGNDLLMPGRSSENKRIKAAIENGTLSEEDLNRNIKKILSVIVQTPNFKNYNYTEKINLNKNAEISRQAASEGIILLKNEDKTLPLKSTKVSLLGTPSYDMYIGGNGSGEVYKAYTISLLDGLRNSNFTVDASLINRYEAHIKHEQSNAPKRMTVLDKFLTYSEPEWTQEELNNMSKNSDVAIVTIGRNAGEGADRNLEKDYYLSDLEIDFLKRTSKAFHSKGKKVVVVLNIDGIVDVSKWQNDVDAIVIAWLPGQEAGNAIADVLNGKVNPSGRLTMTIPADYSDVPSSKAFPGTPADRPETTTYNEGIYVGYRFHNTFNIEPAYEFGYGLSYTKFNYSDLNISSTEFKDKLEVSVLITNTGSVTGKEVVQLYLSAPLTIDKPNEELKGFAKTRSLKPGEKQQITFTINSSDLASFNTKRASWIADAGDYTIKIGSSSKKIHLTKSFSLDKEIVVEKVKNVMSPVVEFEELIK